MPPLYQSSPRPFVSSDMAITANSVHNVAHGLGGVPSSVEAYLVCQTAEWGYAIGDVLKVDCTSWPGTYCVSLVANAVNVFATFIATPIMAHKTGFTIQVATAANWKLRLVAWK